MLPFKLASVRVFDKMERNSQHEQATYIVQGSLNP